jgi:hypothetical protein
MPPATLSPRPSQIEVVAVTQTPPQPETQPEPRRRGRGILGLAAILFCCVAVATVLAVGLDSFLWAQEMGLSWTDAVPRLPYFEVDRWLGPVLFEDPGTPIGG